MSDRDHICNLIGCFEAGPATHWPLHSGIFDKQKTVSLRIRFLVEPFRMHLASLFLLRLHPRDSGNVRCREMLGNKGGADRHEGYER